MEYQNPLWIDDKSERYALIAEEISKAYEHETDDWKTEYYKTVVSYLVENEFFEGSSLCSHCRNQGMEDPHHHNVWGSMVSALNKFGWIEKIGMVEPKSKHNHQILVCEWKSKLYKGDQNA